MNTREKLSPKEIKELEKSAKDFRGKSISLFTKDEVIQIADDNHIWLNAFSCINPTPEFRMKVGNMILEKLNQTEMRDSLGISKMIILTINKS